MNGYVFRMTRIAFSCLLGYVGRQNGIGIGLGSVRSGTQFGLVSDLLRSESGGVSPHDPVDSPVDSNQ